MMGMAALISISFFAEVEINEIFKGTEKIYHYPYKASNGIRDIRTYHYAVISKIHQIEINNPAKNLNINKKIKETFLQIKKSLSILKGAQLKESNEINNLSNSLNDWRNETLKLVQVATNGQWDKFKINKEIFIENDKILEKAIDELFTQSDVQAKMLYKEVAKRKDSVSIIFYVFSGIGILIFGIFAFFLNRSIYNFLIDISNRLQSGSHNLTTKAVEFQESSKVLSGTVSDQASSLQETAASLEELSSMVRNNVGQAEDTKKVSTDVKESAKESLGKIKELELSMKDIVKGNDELGKLVDMIEEIGEKTKIIDDIVFQTKILSVNANIEAEKAGEYGKGFSVVAHEVSELAEISGKASFEISKMVKHGTKSANKIFQENQIRVNEGSGKLENVLETFHKVQKNSDKIFEGAEQILLASKDQSAGITEVNIAVSQLDKATQQNAGLANQSAASATALKQQSDKISSVVVELLKSVGGLKKSKKPAAESHTNSHTATQHKEVLDFKQHKKSRINGPFSTVKNVDDDDNNSNIGNNIDNDKAWGAL